MKIKIELDIDGTQYAAVFAANDDGSALHYDFGKIIYDTIEQHLAVKRQGVLPLVGVETRVKPYSRGEIPSLHD